MAHKMISPTSAVIPHLMIPIHYHGGRPAVNEQDTHDEVLDCVELICRFPKGSLQHNPRFGHTPLEFNTPEPNLGRLSQEISEWEPRVDNLAEWLQEREEFLQHILIKVGDPNA